MEVLAIMISTTATDLPRVMQCLGSVDMPASLPPSVIDEARVEGTAAHWLAQEMFEGREVRAGLRAPNGFTITDAVIDYTSQYVMALDCGQMEVNTSWGDVRGRCDHMKIDALTFGGVLTIDEFKTGYRTVEAYENWTLLSHAIGWCISNQCAPDRIVLRVHQPRAFHPDGPLREWVLDYQTLMGYHARIVERLSQGTGTLQTGPMCLKCPALATCPAAREATMRAMDAITTTFSDELSDAALAQQYDLSEYALKFIEARKDAQMELMKHRITNGAVMNGFALKPSYGHTKWSTGLTGRTLTAMTGVDCVKDGTITPAEAKRRGVPEGVISALTHRPSVGTKLVRNDAQREAREAFGG